VVRQGPVAQTKQDARMTESLGAIERKRLAHVGEILSCKFGSYRERGNAEAGARRERALVSGRADGRRRRLREILELGRLGGLAQRGLARGAEHALALDRDLDSACARVAGYDRNVAVIDRLEKATFGAARLQPGAAPALDRDMRHIGVDFHT